MRIPFTKVQALRNDFVLVDGRRVPVPDPARLAKILCDRKSGVGADTLLVLHHSDHANVLVRIFNPDGSEGEMSGNGTRCVAMYILDRGEGGGGSASVETVAGVSRHDVEERAGRRLRIVSRILAPRFQPDLVPVRWEGDEAIDIDIPLRDRSVRVSCVNIGNPQAVVLDGWDEKNWRELGPQIERHPIFPERANVDFARVVAEGRIEVRLWERGVGPVEASGTGASGAFTVARRKGLVGPRVRVAMEGGDLDLEERHDGLLLRGWCEEVFEGTASIEYPLMEKK
ncbi:MAG: diaminopimelate epimerase [Candidatus Eisenbacteria bacterium]